MDEENKQSNPKIEMSICIIVSKLKCINIYITISREMQNYPVIQTHQSETGYQVHTKRQQKLETMVSGEKPGESTMAIHVKRYHKA